jgi:ribose transport system permease protein
MTRAAVGLLPILWGVIAYLLVAGLFYGTSRFDPPRGAPWASVIVLACLVGLLAFALRWSRRAKRGEKATGETTGRTRTDRPIADSLRQLTDAIGPLLALAIVVLVFAGADAWQGGEGRFWSLGSLRLMMVQAMTIAVASLGMTLVIAAGGIDLSAGTMLALSGTVCALALKHGLGTPASLCLALACGAMCGGLNGVLISGLRLIPFIITLGTMTAFLGIGKSIAEDGGTVTPPAQAVPRWLEEMVSTTPDLQWLAYPLLPNFAWGVWAAFGLAAVMALLLHRTVLGRYALAIGSNESTARLCGVPVTRTKILIYAISGLFVGIAGIYQFARLSKGDATAGLGLELKIIAAVVIGGGSLSGGRASIVGTVCGAMMMSVIANGCTALQLENQVEDILLGIIIVTAVFVDQKRRAATQ